MLDNVYNKETDSVLILRKTGKRDALGCVMTTAGRAATARVR